MSERRRGRRRGDGAHGEAHSGAGRGGGRAAGGRAGGAPIRSRMADPQPWSGERAERYLRSLELFGMRFGLDRMRRMMTALESPQRHFHAVHVVGTNGKSSTTRMIAAILERHGQRTGAYLSPHLISYSERVQVGERPLPEAAFAAAIAKAAWAAERVNRTLAQDDHVTQFELITAAAFWVLAERGVQVAVVEAGLGGRYDATAVVESRVTALTNVGLEHTRWLGPTVKDIAAEKLAVLRQGTALALGADLDPQVLALADALAAERAARIVRVAPGDVMAAALALAVGADPQTAADTAPRAAVGDGPAFAAVSDLDESATAVPWVGGSFQRRNFALARAAAGAYLQSVGITLREDATRAAARASAVVPGRLQVVGEDPLTVLDGAHNPDAARALVEALPEVIDGCVALPLDSADARQVPAGSLAERRAGEHSAGERRPLALVLGVLEDKDAASMLAALLPVCTRAWFTAPPSSRALSPAALQSLARQLGFEETVCEPDPRRALELAQDWARMEGGRTEDGRIKDGWLEGGRVEGQRVEGGRVERGRPRGMGDPESSPRLAPAVLATGSIYLVGDLLAYLAESRRKRGGGA
jgi:dihydrofolate synthase/folylpolyglutamate synthase